MSEPKPMPSYWALAEEVTHLHGQIEKLQAENAELRDELAKWERLADGIDLPEYPVTQFEPKDLERENAKLRELVRDMWQGATTRMDFAERYAFCGEFVDRMREL